MWDRWEAGESQRYKKFSTTFEVYGHLDAGIIDLAAEVIDRQVAAAGAPTKRPQEEADVIELRPGTYESTR